jgi:hypothetical protein
MESQNEWMLTLDGYIKFQIRREANPTAGSIPLKKNLIKILGERSIAKDHATLDAIFDDSSNYMKHMMWSTEEYVVIDSDVRMQVMENASNIFVELKDLYMN